ncbi:MAG TPA: DNA polymerase III subunit delta, partial [Gemmatimonadales bacterium]|nr:DNA polymerase III subunit delta [Gemmatimonadales bacterium]
MAGAFTYPQFRQSLRRAAPAPAYLFTGPEAVLRDEAVQALLDASLDPSLRDFNLDQASAAELDPDRLVALCTTLPMLAERRVVIIRDVQAWRRRTRARSAMMDYLRRPSPETVLVLVQDDEGERGEKRDAEIEKLVQVVEFDRLDADAAGEWLAEKATAVGITFGPGAAEHLLSATRHDLGSLRSELAKLAGFAGGPPVSTEQVGNLVGVRYGESVEDWVDAVLAGRTGAAVRLVELVLGQSGMSGVRMVGVLGSHLLLLGLAADARARRVPAAGLGDLLWGALKAARPGGLGPWGQVRDRVKSATTAWPPIRVEAALRAALEA